MKDTFTSYTVLSGISSTSSIEYPIPGFPTAIETLRPTVIKWELDKDSFSVWEDSEGNPPPSFEEIYVEIEREVQIYNSYWYHRERVRAYPSTEVQLDMLYHDIKSGNLSDGKWIQTLDAIRETYQKGGESAILFEPPTP